VQATDRIKNIQIFNQNNEMILEVKKNYSFPVKYEKGRAVDNILMIKGKKLPELSRGAVVDVIINTKSGDRVKYFCQVSLSTGFQINLTLNVERARQLEERRRYHKIKTAINCRIVDVTRGGELTVFNPNLYGKIYDINLGGIFVSIDTNDVYKKGDMISFTVVLAEKRLEASANVLRVQTDDNDEVVGYGCAFAALPEYQEEMISSYINYIQMEERRIELEKEKIEKEVSRI